MSDPEADALLRQCLSWEQYAELRTHNIITVTGSDNGVYTIALLSGIVLSLSTGHSYCAHLPGIAGPYNLLAVKHLIETDELKFLRSGRGRWLPGSAGPTAGSAGIALTPSRRHARRGR